MVQTQLCDGAGILMSITTGEANDPNVCEREIHKIIDRATNVTARPPLRVAFHTIGGLGWWGGLQYQANLLKAICELGQHLVEPIVFCHPSTDSAVKDTLESAVGKNLVVSEQLAITRSSQRLALSAFGVPNPRINRLFEANRVDVAFENAMLWAPDPGVGVVGWLPDFQHKQMPERFTLLGKMRRELGFRAQQRFGRRIMLSSQDAFDAYCRFYPKSRAEVSIVPFAVPYTPPRNSDVVRATLQKYGVPERFFLVANQFWPHKNHEILVEALRICNSRGKKVTIVSTGSKYCSTGTSTFDRVCSQVSRFGLGESFLQLGMVPYSDLQDLLHSTIAILNPSACEGWNTSVEEAKATAVPLILSDIPVHREQASGHAVFIDTSDPEEWANQLSSAFESYPPAAQRRVLAADLKKAANIRRQRYVERFVEVCQLAYGASS